MQMILQKQIEVLLGDMGLPPELEVEGAFPISSWSAVAKNIPSRRQTIARDIWLLHADQSGVKYEDGDGMPDSGGEEQAGSGGEPASLVRDTLLESRSLPSDDGGDGDGSPAPADDDHDRPEKRGGFTLSRSQKDATKMEWTVAILYVACKWLRLPLMMADFHL